MTSSLASPILHHKIQSSRATGRAFKNLLNASTEELEALHVHLCGEMARIKLTNQRIPPWKEYEIKRKLGWVESELALRPDLLNRERCHSSPLA